MKRSVLRSASILALGAAALSAHAALFDFETSTATFFGVGNRPGGYTSLAVANAGLTLTITRQGGTAFDIVQNAGTQAGKPSSYGTNSLDPFFNGAAGTGFIGNFSSAVMGVSLDAGDYGGDDDTLTLSLYSGVSGTGTLLGTNTISVLGNTSGLFTTGNASVSAFGAQSFVVTGTSTAQGFDNSLFLDNIVATPVATPEPTTWAALSVGAIGLLRRRKRA